MDIARSTVLDVALNQPQWLRSAKGTQTARTITLAPAVGFVSGTHYTTSGRLLSGVYLGKITAVGATQGMYGLYDDTATDGRQTCVGFLYGDVQLALNSAGAVVTATKVGGALLWEGVVSLSAIQAINGAALDAAGQADLAAKFRFE